MGALRAVMATIRAAGLDESVAVCRDVGRAYANSGASRVRLGRAIDNISWAFPDWSPERVREVAVASCSHLFGLAAEMAWTPHLFDEDQADADGWPRRIVIDDSAWPAIEILRRRQPTILICGHGGNWEVLGATIAHFGFRLHALYRPLNFRAIDRWVRQTRSRRGLELVDKYGAVEALPEIIGRGDPLGFIADQNAGLKGVFVPFFDRLASTYKSIGLTAMQFDAPLICGQARRTVDPATRELRYRIEVFDIIRPDEWAEQPDALFYISARYRRAIEAMVRAAPEQYLWLHRCWKTRPKFEQRGKPMPPALREKIAALPWMTDESLARIDDRSARDAHEAAAASKAASQ
ncbi:MAG: lysophospholipid acyltransferase family protein [Phycisphaerales bacterium]